MFETIKPYGRNALIVEWHQVIKMENLDQISSLFKILKAENLKGIMEIVPGYASLTIIFLPEVTSFEILKNHILHYSQISAKSNSDDRDLWQIPVKYLDKYHKDVSFIMQQKNLSVKEIIQLHSEQIYDVCFLGFLPGFMYLSGLGGRLHLPRKATPDLNVKSGSVAIGGAQTGVYPQDSPGGWYVIGHTDFNFFDPTKPPYCTIKAGDRIVFVPS